MKKFIVGALCLLSLTTYAQENDSLPKDPNWKLKATYGLNGTQSSFVNWSAGGRNNISVLAYIDASANYAKGNFKWETDLGLALGGLQYIGKGATGGLQKTDDRIDLATSLGYRMKEHWYASFVGGFRTQMLDGFNFPNDSVRVSKFMAPGYVNLALGIDYSPTKNFTMFLSPISSKMTFVQDPQLANAGAFGVEASYYEADGSFVAGKQFRGEFGAYFKLKYNQTIAKNIEMKSKLELFSNYLDNPENIDVNAEVIFNFKINSWFSASVNWNAIYDHDIRITDADGNVGPRLQFKSVLGLGISYTMRNFTEKKK